MIRSSFQSALICFWHTTNYCSLTNSLLGWPVGSRHPTTSCIFLHPHSYVCVYVRTCRPLADVRHFAIRPLPKTHAAACRAIIKTPMQLSFTPLQQACTRTHIYTCKRISLRAKVYIFLLFSSLEPHIWALTKTHRIRTNVVLFTQFKSLFLVFHFGCCNYHIHWQPFSTVIVMWLSLHFLWICADTFRVPTRDPLDAQVLAQAHVCAPHIGAITWCCSAENTNIRHRKAYDPAQTNAT